MKTTVKFFIKNESGKLIPADNKVRATGYYLAGFQDEKNKGFLYCLNYESGTKLVPVFDENGKQIKNINLAGKDFSA